MKIASQESVKIKIECQFCGICCDRRNFSRSHGNRCKKNVNMSEMDKRKREDIGRKISEASSGRKRRGHSVEAKQKMRDAANRRKMVKEDLHG